MYTNYRPQSTDTEITCTRKIQNARQRLLFFTAIFAINLDDKNTLLMSSHREVTIFNNMLSLEVLRQSCFQCS